MKQQLLLDRFFSLPPTSPQLQTIFLGPLPACHPSASKGLTASPHPRKVPNHCHSPISCAWVLCDQDMVLGRYEKGGLHAESQILGFSNQRTTQKVLIPLLNPAQKQALLSYRTY